MKLKIFVAGILCACQAFCAPFDEDNPPRTPPRKKDKNVLFESVFNSCPGTGVTPAFLEDTVESGHSVGDSDSLNLNDDYTSREWLKRENFILLDLETTGLKFEDKIVQIAMAEYSNGQIIGTYNTYLNPGPEKLRTYASTVHKLTPGYLARQRKFEDVWPEVRDFIGDRLVVTYNAAYDARMLMQEFKRMDPDNIQTGEWTLKTKCLLGMYRRDCKRKAIPEKNMDSPQAKRYLARCMGLDAYNQESSIKRKENEEKKARREQNKSQKAENLIARRLFDDENDGGFSQESIMDSGPGGIRKQEKTRKLRSSEKGRYTLGSALEKFNITTTLVGGIYGVDYQKYCEDNNVPEDRRTPHDAVTDVYNAGGLIEVLRQMEVEKEIKSELKHKGNAHLSAGIIQEDSMDENENSLDWYENNQNPLYIQSGISPGNISSDGMNLYFNIRSPLFNTSINMGGENVDGTHGVDMNDDSVYVDEFLTWKGENGFSEYSGTLMFEAAQDNGVLVTDKQDESGSDNIFDDESLNVLP